MKKFFSIFLAVLLIAAFGIGSALSAEKVLNSEPLCVSRKIG